MNGATSEKEKFFAPTVGLEPLTSRIDDTWSRPDFFSSHDEAEEFLGALDAAFLFAYAAGLYVSGSIADRHDLRIVLSLGMWLTAVMVFLFGPIFEWVKYYSQPAYIAVMVVNGLLQSLAWPSVVAVMGNWFGKGSRGLVFGLWSACQSVGNIIGALLVSLVVDFGYEYAFLLTSCILFGGGIVVFFGLVPTPREIGLSVTDEEDAVDVNEAVSMEFVVDKQKNGPAVDNNVGYFLNGPMPVHNGLSHDVSKTENANEVNGDLVTTTVTSEKGFVEVACPKLTKDNETTQMAINEQSRRNGKRDLQGTGVIKADTKNGVDITDIKAEMAREMNRSESPRIETAAGLSPNADDSANNTDTRPKAINFCTALLLPGVIPYSLAYAFLKLVNYSFFFWLPFYLSNAYNWRESTADQLSTWYDVGGIIGGTVAGFVSDRIQKRAVVVVPMLVLGIPMLFVYSSVEAGGQMLVNAVMLCCTGLLVGGVANLISAAISADLGRQEAIRGNSEALSTVTGIVDGTGSLGAAIGQVAVPFIQVGFGWRSVFYLFMAAILCTIVCILPILTAEAKDLWRLAKKRRVRERTISS
nr:hypothetical protein BaRGS_009036 [Batillaria attramentaria]